VRVDESIYTHLCTGRRRLPSTLHLADCCLFLLYLLLPVADADVARLLAAGYIDRALCADGGRPHGIIAQQFFITAQHPSSSRIPRQHPPAGGFCLKPYNPRLALPRPRRLSNALFPCPLPSGLCDSRSKINGAYTLSNQIAVTYCTEASSPPRARYLGRITATLR
jgi:hypothetical protein